MTKQNKNKNQQKRRADGQLVLNLVSKRAETREKDNNEEARVDIAEVVTDIAMGTGKDDNQDVEMTELTKDNIEEDTTTEKRQRQTKIPGSILRQQLRAKYSEVVIRNPYTPRVVRTSIRAEQKPQGSPSRQVKTVDTQWRSRFTLKLTIPASNSATDTFSRIVKDFIRELKATCSELEEITILPWAEKDLILIDSVTVPEDFPGEHTSLLRYFPKAYAGNGSERVCYTKVHIGHDCDLKELESNIKFWLMSNSHGLYFDALQSEDAVMIGWLMWSQKTMDPALLAEDILELTGVRVGLRWMAIDVGAVGKVAQKDKIYALHIEVDRKEKRNAKKALLQLYGRVGCPLAELPLYLRLRFVTPFSQAISGHAKTKLRKCINRQKEFLQKICSTTTNIIVHLDHRATPHTSTLRELMMEIPSKRYDNMSVFFSVDLNWQRTNYIVSYVPAMKEEAEHTLQSLLPHLRYLISKQEAQGDFEPLTKEQLHSYFTEEAVEDTEDMYFDEQLQRIVDPLMDGNLQVIVDDNLLTTEEEDTENTEDRLPARPALQLMPTGIFPGGGDDDSVSTMGISTATGSVTSGASRRLPRVRRSPQSDEHSSLSSNTGVSVEAFSDLKRDVSQLTTLLSSFMNQNQQSQTSPIINRRVSFSPGGDKSPTRDEKS